MASKSGCLETEEGEEEDSSHLIMCLVDTDMFRQYYKNKLSKLKTEREKLYLKIFECVSIGVIRKIE